MKKVFVLFAVAAMIVACNKPAQKVEDAVDSVETVVVEEVIDSAALVVDSTLNAAADSVAAAVN